MKIRFALFLLLAAAFASVRAAEAPVETKWDDLIAALPASDNPYAQLSVEQIEALGELAAFRWRKANGGKLLSQEVAIEREYTAKLEKKGVDIDAMLSKRDEFAQKIKALESVPNPAIEGKLIRMPGFLLPLEFTGKQQVTEFLLVPWAGACIHTPPPPPNQIVYVKLDKPYDVRRQFDAVWVTGRITGGAVQKSLFITDGSTNVDIGYSMRASQVEPYR